MNTVVALFLVLGLFGIADCDIVPGERRFETVHGRILAVNDNLVKQRRNEAAGKVENTFESIEINNEAKHFNFYQGDIRLDAELEKIVHSPRNEKFKRNAVRAKKRLWTSRIIPYHIPSHMSHIYTNLMAAITEFHKHTCLRFVRYNGHRNYITFGNNDGCSSRFGKKHFAGGKQTISLGNGCNWRGTIIHELLHALGFLHEQSRSDRDKFVVINYENIVKGAEDQFTKYSWKDVDDLGKDYDYQSIMHYDRFAFTKNGKPTIQAIHDPNMKFGNPSGVLSTKDIIEINALYDCTTKRYGWTAWSSYTPCDDDCKKYRERYCYHSGNIKSCGGNVNAYGIERQTVVCTNCPEPANGHWGHWSSWSACSVTCNDGKKKRYRVCNNPPPAHGGRACPGRSSEADTCTERRCHLDYNDADFENHRMGVWSNTAGDQFDWTLHRGPVRTMNTGALRDHTTGNGYYLYTESSAPRAQGDRANLVTPWMPYVPGGQCIKFAYAMYGKTIGKLALKVELEGLNTKYYVFYKTGNQGQGWKTATGNIDPPASVRYRLTFEATVGQPGYSDFAIDDVYIDQGLCNCQDSYVTCSKWANLGECAKKAKWMGQHCKRSCYKCIKKVCADSDPIQCPLWAGKGECTKNPVYMEKNCQKSCKICT